MLRAIVSAERGRRLAEQPDVDGLTLRDLGSG
jgi:hypothetical protein